jgi:lipopolysaccharide/colanic/teichoic acid biosynthesis glycosyltransferase
MKRAFDIVFSALGLVVLLPLFALIGALILAFDGRPVFYCQERIGYRGQPFRIWKFRTMVRDAERLGKPLTVGGDPRITSLGHWLRKTKLDELPQLWNVLVGEMSFVGPRPEVERYVDRYTPAQSRVLDLVPGITDAASIAYRNETELLKGFENPEQAYIEEIIPTKIRLNLEYATQANVFRDCVVIFRTVGRLCWRG